MRLVPPGLGTVADAVLYVLRGPAPSDPVAPRTRRVVRTGPGLVHLQVRGVHRSEGEPVARSVERSLASEPGVRWAAVNPLLGEVVVAVEDGMVDVDDLSEVLDDVEAAHGVLEGDLPTDLPAHPADDRPLTRAKVALVADGAGVGVGLTGRILRLPRLPVEVASVVPAIDTLAPVRRLLEARPGVDLAAILVNAALQGLGQGVVGLAVDATHRASLATELVARRRAWLAAEHRLYPGPVEEGLAAADEEPRPVPLPPGPIERYGRAASVGSLGGGGITLAVTGDPRKTADVLLAGSPRAARMGREGFASQIGRALAARQVLPMDPRVLRRLERVDAVLIDVTAITAPAFTFGEIVALTGQDRPAVEAAARSLFDPARPGVPHEAEGWALAPVPQTTGRLPEGADQLVRELAGTDVGVGVLALSRAGDIVGLVSVQPLPRPSTAELVAATRRAGHLLALATVGTSGDDAFATVGTSRDTAVGASCSGMARVVGADRVLPGGPHLARSVRQLQAEGRVVALVSPRPGSALLAADCGIGIVSSDEPHPPWGADLICLQLADASAVIDATRLARTACRQAVVIAAAGSVAAELFALGSSPGSGRRAITATQLSTLAAIASGTWTGTQLPRRAVRADDLPTAWHNLDASEVLRRLRTSPEGLTAAEAETRNGPEPEQPRPGFSSFLLEELANPLTVVLGVGAALSAMVGSAADAAMIAGALGLDAAVGAAQRVRAETAIGQLAAAVTQGAVRVLRAGDETLSDASSLVSGDVIRLSAGQVVPADCRLLDAAGLEADESSLTGESLPVPKGIAPVPSSAPVAERSSMVFAGTAVAAGRGTAVVVATGPGTEARRGASGAQPQPTGVETRLRALTDRTVPVVLAAGAGLALNGLVRGGPPREAVASGVSLAAAAVPEGLPFVATVAQASAARRLAARGVLVRNPGVLEALGRVDVLCFDKTGTLTEGHLRLQRVADGVVDEPVTELGTTCRRVLAAALRATPRPRAGGLPHPTDQAVVDGAAAAGVTASLGVPGWRKQASLPFEPGRAYHAVLGRTHSGLLLCVKGAPEVVLPRCDTWQRTESDVVELDESARATVGAEGERLAQGGLRVLAVAERPATDRGELDGEGVAGLKLLGFVGVADSARAGAPAPLEALWKAGINVVMVTGDHPSTAEAVASDLGLLNGRRVLVGSELERLDDETLEQVVPHVAVFARVTPADKVRIVGAFQRSGRVVAMTGDGANDAQAIRLAEIGVAFGGRATSAARDAADLVVTRDDVEALVDAIVEGRAMWGSVRRALGILLGGNLGEVAFTTGAALLTGRSPLSARQLLAVNLFTDLAPAMAIAVQAPTDGRIDLTREGPEASLSGQLGRDIVVRATATAAGASTAWLAARLTGSSTRARTVAMVALVGSQLGQTLVIGRRDPLVAGAAIVSAAGLVAIVQIPGISQFFGCRPLGPLGWTIAAGASGLATASSVAALALLDGGDGSADGPIASP